MATTALLSRSAAGVLRTIVPPTIGLEPHFVGASEDGSLVVFESRAALPGAGPAVKGGPNLYAWDRSSGQIRSVATFNDGEAPAEGAFGGSYDWARGTTETALAQGGAALDYDTQDQYVVSASGSAVYFTAAGTGALFSRLNPGAAQSPIDEEGRCLNPALACTVAISAPHEESDVAPGTAAFMAAGADGSEAFFTSAEELTSDANTGPAPLQPKIARAAIDDNPTSVEADFLPASAVGVAVDGAHLYWANPSRGSIGRANLDGSGIEEDFISGLGNPRWVAVGGGFVYWTSSSGGGSLGEGTIGRARIDGASALEPGFISGIAKPQGIAVNESKIYWANDAAPAIGRANLDGSEVEPGFHPLGRSEVPQGVAADGSHIYWTENEPAAYVSRSDLDGSNEVFEFAGATAEVRGVAIDGGHVYWATSSGIVGRANLDLAEVERTFISGAGRAIGLALDDLHLYWATARVVGPGADLYRYDADGGELTDLSPDPVAANGAEVKGVLGISRSGAYVYFVANGVLASSPNDNGETALPGSCEGTLGAMTGTCNLYASHAGTVDFIARLDADGGAAESDAANWAAAPAEAFGGVDFQRTARVSEDGRTLLFRSQRQLGDYASNGTPELYLYRAGNAYLTCVSCDPSGAAPVGPPTLASIVPPTGSGAQPAAQMTRNLSADGKRVFFESLDPLVEADDNGDEGCPNVGLLAQEFPACRDVYEWEAAGTGSCREAAPGGCLYLLSTSQKGEPAFFADASASGTDAFFFTRARLVAQDSDEFMDVYDARVEGGLAAQNEVPVKCNGEGCRPAASAPPQAEEIGSEAVAASTDKPRRSRRRCSGPGRPKGRHCDKHRCACSRHRTPRH